MVLNCDWHELLGYFVVSVDGCSVYSERCYVWHWHSWTVKARRAVAKYWYLLNEIRPVPEFSLQNLAVSVLLRRTLCFYMNVLFFWLRFVVPGCESPNTVPHIARLWERASTWRIRATPCTSSLEICATLKASVTMKNSSCDLDFEVWTLPCVERQWVVLSGECG